MVQRASRHRSGKDVFTDPLFLATAFAAVLLVGLAKGGFSGIGMAATPLLALAVPLAIAANFLGFWLVLRTSTELFYRIAYGLMFLVSAAIFAQGVTGLLRG